MKEKWNHWVEGLNEETTMTKRELTLVAAVCALAGMVVGMLAAKIATGWSWSFSFASNNGNNNTNGGEINGAACAKADGPDKKKKCKKEKNRGQEEA